MKKLSNLLAALVFGSLVIFMSCGKDEGPDAPSIEETVAAALNTGTWTAEASNVTYGGVPEGDWSGFTIRLSGNASGTTTGNYTTSGTPAGYEDVMPASGTWTFVEGSNAEQIIRTGGNAANANNVLVGIKVDQTNVPPTTLTMSFQVEDPNARTSGLYGATWSFSFGQQ